MLCTFSLQLAAAAVQPQQAPLTDMQTHTHPTAPSPEETGKYTSYMHMLRATPGHKVMQPTPHATTTTFNRNHIQPQLHSTATTFNHNHIQPQPHATATTCNHNHIQPPPHSTTTTFNHHHIQPQPHAATSTTQCKDDACDVSNANVMTQLFSSFCLITKLL